jgi:hypothetical protein
VLRGVRAKIAALPPIYQSRCERGGANARRNLRERKLSAKNDVDLIDAKQRPKSVETLGIDLRKKVCNNGGSAQGNSGLVRGALGSRARTLRNVVSEDVERMIDGIRDLVARNPA